MKKKRNHDKIRCVHIITKLELGGAQDNTLYTLEHLPAERYEKILISGTGGMRDEEAINASSYEALFVPSLRRKINPLMDLLALFKLYALLRKLKPAIVHTHSSKAGILGRWAAFLARTPVIIHTYHGFGFNDYQHPLKRALLVASERLTAPVTTAFIAVSKNTMQTGIKNRIGRPEKYTVIYSGIHRRNNKDVDRNSVRRELGFNDEDILITNISCLKPQKNVVDFVRIAHDLVQKNSTKKLHFLIIGDGEERPKIESLVTKLGLSGIVHLLGWRRDAHTILSASDIFVLTSLWEGLPRSLLEAMDACLPCCVYSVDGIKDIIEYKKSIFAVSIGDFSAIVETLDHLVNYDTMRRKIGYHSANRFQKEFYIDTMLESINILYMAQV